ncbi:hypothetical protein GF351_02620 [Candidatus Woesearchaeota archaeon]|nr:hypothetical protein [Candidatus Woesearchaeota archaeon]
MLKSRLNVIKQEYDSFYKALLSRGKLPAKDTGKGYWGTADPEEVFTLFQELKLQSYRSFLDLGSGDGKVVMIASLFTRAAGIEYDQELHEKAEEIRKRLSLKAKLIRGDFFGHDLSKYDIIFIFPDKPMNRGLEKKLKKEFKGKLVHYGFHFHPRKLKLEKRLQVKGNLVSVYCNS